MHPYSIDAPLESWGYVDNQHVVPKKPWAIFGIWRHNEVIIWACPGESKNISHVNIWYTIRMKFYAM